MQTFSKEKNPLQSKFPKDAHRNLTTGKSSKFQRLSTDASEESIIRVGKYRIFLEEELGRGYSSVVYKAGQEGKNFKKYAIKCVNLKSFSPSCIRMFNRQIEIHRKLNHENVVKCHDVIKTPGKIYLVMEYCPHGSLQSFIKHNQNAKEKSVIEIMGQVIEGYKYLIDQEILHRDLKPANILRAGRKWKISDFGFSIKSKCLLDDVNVGTPLYMPMESLARSYYSIKTDFFAIGVIMYELLHRKTPWECKNERELMKKLGQEKLVFQRRVINSKVKEFIEKCCCIDEDRRMPVKQFIDFRFEEDSKKEGQIAKTISRYTSSFNLIKMQDKLLKNRPSTASNKDYIKENSEILLSELGCCRFIFDMTQNIEFFCLQEFEKNTLLVVLLKFIIRSVQNLGNQKYQRSVFKKYEQFVKTQEYSQLSREINEYTRRFQTSFLDSIRVMDIKVIRTVNSQFKEFVRANSNTLGKTFFVNLKSYIISCIKESNQILGLKINDSSQNCCGSVEALNSLFTLNNMISCKENGQKYQKQLRFLNNFQQSKLNKIDYLRMRKDVKLLQ